MHLKQQNNLVINKITKKVITKKSASQILRSDLL